MTLFHHDEHTPAERRILELKHSIGTTPEEVRQELRALACRIHLLREVLPSRCEDAAWADAECGETTPTAEVL